MDDSTLSAYKSAMKSQRDLYFEAARAQCSLLPLHPTPSQLNAYKRAVVLQAEEYDAAISVMKNSYKKAKIDISWGTTPLDPPVPKNITVYSI